MIALPPSFGAARSRSCHGRPLPHASFSGVGPLSRSDSVQSSNGQVASASGTWRQHASYSQYCQTSRSGQEDTPQ